MTAGPGLTNTVTALKNAQLAQSPVVLLGGATPTLLQGRGALQDIDQRPVIAPHVKFLRQVRRVQDIGLAIEEAFAAAREGVQGPAFIELPIDLLYAEPIVRHWYGEASGKGRSISDTLLRYYINRHVERLFGGGQPSAPRGSKSGGACRPLI